MKVGRAIIIVKEGNRVNFIIHKYQHENREQRQTTGEICAQTSDAHIAGDLVKYEPPANAPFSVELIAECDRQLIGFLEGDLCMGPNNDGEIVILTPWQGYIHSIGVYPRFRRKGIGQLLIDAALEQYWNAGCTTVELCTLSSNATEFFLSCGARPCTNAPEGYNL